LEIQVNKSHLLLLKSFRAQDLLVSVTEKSEKREIAFEMLEDKKNNREDLLINGQHLIGDLKKYSSISIKPLEDLISKAKVNFNDSFTLGLDMTYEVFMPSFEVPQVNIATIDPYNYDVFSLGKQFQQSFGPISQENKGQRLFMETARNERSTKNLLDINVDTTLSQPFEDLLAYAPSFGVSSTKTTTSSKKLFGNNGSIQEFGFREPILTERSTFFNNINHQDAKKSPMPKSLAIKTKALPVQDLENYSQIANSSIFIQDQNESLLTNPQYLPNEGKKNPTRLRNENIQLTFREAIGGSVSPPKGHDIIEQTMKARRKHSIKVSDRFEPIIDGIKKKTLENADLTGAGNYTNTQYKG